MEDLKNKISSFQEELFDIFQLHKHFDHEYKEFATRGIGYSKNSELLLNTLIETHTELQTEHYRHVLGSFLNSNIYQNFYLILRNIYNPDLENWTQEEVVLNTSYRLSEMVGRSKVLLKFIANAEQEDFTLFDAYTFVKGTGSNTWRHYLDI